ncbi:MAG: agmatinase [Pseudomonadales bacterium]
MTDNEHFSSHSMFANTFGYLSTTLSRNIANADVVVMGIPYDLGTTGRAGTRQGPQGIRRASANLRWEEKRWPWRFNAFDRISVVDYGDLEFPPGESESMLTTVTETATSILEQGKKLLSFGGDHFVTLPLLRAVSKIHGPVAMIHFDAHTDTYEESDRYDHGCMFYHAPREGLISAEHTIQLGIRTEYNAENHEFTVLDAATVNDMAADAIIEKIRETVGDMPVYLTFDIDGLDPAFAPGTGTPVVGGMSTDKALKIIRGLSGLNLVAMDIVEVAPCYDHADITALAAATLGLEMLYVTASTV